MNFGPAEIGLIMLAVMLLFGYKKLPDASRSLGRSLRIFKGEMSSTHEEPPTAAPVIPAQASAASSALLPTSAPARHTVSGGPAAD